MEQYDPTFSVIYTHRHSQKSRGEKILILKIKSIIPVLEELLCAFLCMAKPMTMHISAFQSLKRKITAHSYSQSNLYSSYVPSLVNNTHSFLCPHRNEKIICR